MKMVNMKVLKLKFKNLKPLNNIKGKIFFIFNKKKGSLSERRALWLVFVFGWGSTNLKQ